MSNKYNHIEEEELIALMRKEDSKAVDILYEKYSSAVFAIILRVVHDREIAEDVLQEAFVKFWKSFDSYSEDRGRLYTWLINIARNLAIDKIRSKSFRNTGKNQSIEDNVFIIDNKNSIGVNPDTMDVKALTNNLKPKQKEIIELVYFKGYTHVEVAEELDLPLGTVKTRLRMGIMELRKYFEK